MNVPDLIDEALRLLDTDQAGLAKRLSVGDSAVSKWRSGKTVPDYESCLRLARETGMDAHRVLTEAGHDTRLLPEALPVNLSPYMRDVLERSRQTQEILDSVEGLPDDFVPVVLGKILDRTKEEIDERIKMVLQLRAAEAKAQQRGRNTRRRTHPDTQPVEADNTAFSEDGPQIPTCQQGANESLTSLVFRRVLVS